MKPYAKHKVVRGSNPPGAKMLAIWTVCGRRLDMPYDTPTSHQWTDTDEHVTCKACRRRIEASRRPLPAGPEGK